MGCHNLLCVQHTKMSGDGLLKLQVSFDVRLSPNGGGYYYIDELLASTFAVLVYGRNCCFIHCNMTDPIIHSKHCPQMGQGTTVHGVRR